MNGGRGYAFHAAWSAEPPPQQLLQLQAQVAAAPGNGRSLLAAACTSSSGNNQGISGGASPTAGRASWTVPDLLYDHASLLECTRYISQGQLTRGRVEGHDQGIANMLDRESLLQEMQINMDEDDEMSMGIEMKTMKKRKLTNDQARQLEASFELDKKLEAEKKQRLAEQLGLQPRQVAVWFQNRRARSKTKQLELDFLALKIEYDRVLAQRQRLQDEIARLTGQLQSKCAKTLNNSFSEGSTSSTNSNHGDVVSRSTTMEIKGVHDPGRTREFGEVFTSSSLIQDHEKGMESAIKVQQNSRSPCNYDWGTYDNGLWVFD